MGCYPLGKMVSDAFGCCSGKKRTVPRTVAASPLSIIHCDKAHMARLERAMSKSVTFNDNPIIMRSPEPTQVTPTLKHHPEVVAYEAKRVVEAVEQKPEPRVRFADEPAASDGVSHGWNRNEPRQAHTGPDHHQYVMSPLPVWEEREGRREYFSREYHHYPTPLREGIYSIATDANRLTTIFSDENPNACIIV